MGGRPVEMTSTGYEPLYTLSVNARRVMTTDALLRRVRARSGDAGVQAVRNFVKKLRRKRGVGYRMPKPGGA